MTVWRVETIRLGRRLFSTAGRYHGRARRVEGRRGVGPELLGYLVSRDHLVGVSAWMASIQREEESASTVHAAAAAEAAAPGGEGYIYTESRKGYDSGVRLMCDL